MIETWAGEATPERGSRPKRMVRVTEEGERAAMRFYSAIRRASTGAPWQAVPKEVTR